MDISCLDTDVSRAKDLLVKNSHHPNSTLLLENNFKYTESDSVFDTFMYNSPLLAWIVDEAGYYRYVNTPYKKTLENGEDVTGKNLFDLYPKKLADQYFANNKKVIETNSPLITVEQVELPYKILTNKVIKFPIFYGGAKMIAAWALNISDQLSTQENLVQLNHHKDKLISLMAHDIRGPLAINVSFIDSILDEFEQLDKATLYKYLLMLKDSIAKCYQLVDEMLAWGRDQLAKSSFSPKNFNIETEVFKVVDSLWELINQKKLLVNTKFSFSGEIYADVDMFIIVLRNLISNAIKFSYPNTTISIQTTKENDKVCLRVMDSGIGMSKELIAKIQNKENIDSKAGTKGEKGTGLGLNLVKDYINQNGGELIIESEEGIGSCFQFTMPINVAG